MRPHHHYSAPSLPTPLLHLLLLLASHTTAWYLPGVAPTTYKRGDRVPLHVNALTPSQSQIDGEVHSVYSYDYYDSSFHFCQPDGGPEQISESLGSILFGDRIQTSPFELHMAQDEPCKTIPGCGKRRFEAADAKFVNELIWKGYDHNWLIDGLPAGSATGHYWGSDENDQWLRPGFSLGMGIIDGDKEKVVFYNHYNIIVDYHVVGADQYRVVGVRVEPSSNKDADDFGAGSGQCSPAADLILDEEGPTDVIFTYSVAWVNNPNVHFATRWDKYLHVYDASIHWLSMIASAGIVVLLCSMVFVILARSLHKDITRYNKLDQFALSDLSGDHALPDDDIQDDSGWKLIHGDVFRPPPYPLALSILTGNGAQLFLMCGFTIALAGLGFLSPSNRGALGSVTILLYIAFSSVSGFTSTYIYTKLFHGTDAKYLKYNIAITPLALPLTIFSTFFLLNLFLWFNASSGAVPFTTMLVLIFIYFVISLPLSIGGSYLALKYAPPYTPPVKTNQIPRQIPDPATLSTTNTWLSTLNRPLPAILLSGILPFAAIAIELYFILSSLWSTHIYYMFGFLFLSYGLMLVTTASVTVLNVYFMLCAEDYRWQWRAWATGAACAVYVFANAIVFWMGRLSFGGVTSVVLYLGYSGLVSGAVGVLMGSVGVVGSWGFVHVIYGRLKVD